MSEPRQQRRLAAILAADVVGYTRAMGTDEAGTHARLQALIGDTIRPAVTARGGRVFKEMGDGCLAEFPSAVDAAQCAAEIQAALAASGSALQLRIGLHLGDVIVEGDDLFGDGVIIASRLQAEAGPGGVVASAAFRQHVEGRAGLAFEDAGICSLKNVDDPVQVFTLSGTGSAARRRGRGPARRLALTLVAVTAVAILAFLQGPDFFAPAPPRANGAPTIAVLPFENLSHDPEQAFFAEGLAEDLITDLSKLAGVQVISRTSSFAVDRQMPAAEVAARLNARYIVAGSVRRAGDQLRITANLIDSQTDRPLWADRFDGAGSDVFGFQDQITGRIIEALKVQLTPAEQQAVTTHGTSNPAAYDAYLRGLRLLAARRRIDTEANAAAQAAFQEAIRLDPGYALAYAGLGWSKWLYVESISSFMQTIEPFSLAEESLALADNALARRVLAKQHFALFSYWVFTTRNIDQAVAELEHARRLQPSDPDVLADLATALPFAGRPDEALALIRKAMELNPNHPDWYFAASGIALLLSGQPERAVEDLRKWSGSESSWNVPYVFYASALALSGAQAKANTALAIFDKLSGTLSGPDVTARRDLDIEAPTETFGIRTSIYAMKRRWPMAPEQEAIFVEGLRLAGMKGED